ncbi:MAG: uncharacterized protein QOJ15_3916, partial [Bradyrhizobium sp.]|nr:uncharacterized protein [Bradyrhizobium sp.]
MHERIHPGRRSGQSPDTVAGFTTAAVTRVVGLSCRYAWPVIVGLLLISVACGAYFVRNFAITTDSNKLLSSSLPWRQQEVRLDRAFPQRIDRIVAVIEATTPEGAENAARALLTELSSRPDLFRTVSRAAGGEFFERNGILFESLDEVQRDTADLISAQPFLGMLAVDPTLRGIFRTLSQSLEGVRIGKAKLDDLRPALASIADTLEAQASGKPATFSWRTLIAGRIAKRSELRQFLYVQPALDFADLQPGKKATAAIREAASRLELTPEQGVRVRLTGSV